MKTVVDDVGKPILGIFRDLNGGLIIDDKNSLNKYYSELKDKETIISLQTRLETMETQIKQLMGRHD